jgi:hypothetical protein
MNKTIPVESIEDGMVLGNSVLNQFSQVLIPAGTVLTSFHKNILARWDVSFIQVKVENESVETTIPEEILLQAKNYVIDKMLWTPENDIEEDLMRTSIKLKALSLILKGNEYATN